MYVPTVSALAFATLTLSSAAAGQQLRHGPWEPWYGCWRAEGAPSGQSVCILPDEGGIRMVTIEQSSVQGDSRIYADGVSRRTDRDGCAMEEWARWSADRERVFLSSELTCDGRVTRTSQGILSFTSPDQWVSVQTITGEEGSAVRTVRFSPAYGVRLPTQVADLAPTRALRVSSIDPVDESDVVEATEILDPEAVQEWLHATGSPFQVTDNYAGAGSSSALDDLAYVSRPVEYRTVNIVHILEPTWCIYGSCGWLRSAWWWDPWAYDRFAWRVLRPVYYLRPPLLIRIGVNLGLGHGIRIARYDGWGRDRGPWRYSYNDGWRWYREPGRGVAWARGSVSSARGYEPPYGGSRPPISRSSTDRTSGRGEPAGTGSARGTAVVRGSGTRTATPGGTAVERGGETRPGSTRGTVVERSSETRPGSTRGTVSGRGYGAPGVSSREPSVSRPDQPTSTPRGTAIMRGSRPESSPPRASGSSRGSEARPSITRSEPRPSVTRGSSDGGSSSRASEPRSSGARGTASSGGGYSSGSGTARGTARRRQ